MWLLIFWLSSPFNVSSGDARQPTLAVHSQAFHTERACRDALRAMLLASGLLPGWAILPLMGGIGFCTGVAGPSRDLLVRKAATARFGKAAYGRVYGFVYSGLDLGLALAPVIFGGLMDARRFGSVLVGIAVFQTLAIFTALRVGKAD